MYLHFLSSCVFTFSPFLCIYIFYIPCVFTFSLFLCIYIFSLLVYLHFLSSCVFTFSPFLCIYIFYIPCIFTFSLFLCIYIFSLLVYLHFLSSCVFTLSVFLVYLHFLFFSIYIFYLVYLHFLSSCVFTFSLFLCIYIFYIPCEFTFSLFLCINIFSLLVYLHFAIYTFSLWVFKWTFTFETSFIPSWTDLFRPHPHTFHLNRPTSTPSYSVVCLLTFVWCWMCITMTLIAETWCFGYSKTSVMSDLIQNNRKTSQVRWNLKIDTWCKIFARDLKYFWFHEHSKNRIHFLAIYIYRCTSCYCGYICRSRS